MTPEPATIHGRVEVEGARPVDRQEHATPAGAERPMSSAPADPADTASAVVEQNGFLRPATLHVVGGGVELPPTLYADAGLRSLRSRAAAYARAGVPIHFRGPAGTGKTTLALQIAGDLGRPVSFLTGDRWLSSAGLVGHAIGEATTRLHDRFVQRVTRTESRSRAIWADSVLTTALREGRTLIYDEFTRSPAETNNVLLSVLEERVIALASPASDERVVRADPHFRIILTSNPEDYAGVLPAPDALLDRMITFEIGDPGPGAEAGILQARTGLGPKDADCIVRLLRTLRRRMPRDRAPSLRTAILIGRLCHALGVSPSEPGDAFVQICLDVLGGRGRDGSGESEKAAYEGALLGAIAATCRRGRPCSENPA